VNEPGGLRLARPRDFREIFADSLRILWQHLPKLLVLSSVVVVPVSLIVSGVGLEQLTSRYDSNPPPAEYALPGLVNVLVVTPLISAICIRVLLAVEQGGAPQARQALVEGFEAFSPIFLAVLLAAAGIALGLILFVAPGVYLFVRWYFVPQAVVVEGARGPAALARSGVLTSGYWWRTFGIWVFASLIALIPAAVLAAPFTSLAESTDHSVWALVGMILAEIVSAPFLALVSTLLYYDLRARGPKTR
jgi:hypothetical protein